MGRASVQETQCRSAVCARTASSAFVRAIEGLRVGTGVECKRRGVICDGGLGSRGRRQVQAMRHRLCVRARRRLR